MLLALIRKEWLALARDPHGLAALFVMPVIFIIIMSLALKDYYSPATRQLSYAIVQLDTGALAQTLAAQWQATHGEPAPLPSQWRAALIAGQLRYVIVLEAGLSKALSSPATPPGIKARLLAEPGLEHALMRSTEAELAATVGELRANALQERFMGMVATGANAISKLVSAERVAPRVRPSAVQQNVPAWLVFGMFFVVTAIAGLFVQEQRDGTLARLHSIGVPRSVQILGKALPYFAINAVQAVLMLGVGVWLMPHLGGDRLSLVGIHWGALLFMLSSISAAAIGFALALACLVRTHAQAAALGATCNLLMAAIGGIMVPAFVMPQVMQTVASFSPMNWGLEGLLQVLLREGGISAVLPYATRLLAFATLMWLAASLLFRHRLK